MEAQVLSYPSFFKPARPRLSRLQMLALSMLSATTGCLTVMSLAATSAQAALVSTGACNSATLSTPFARWGDTNLYELVPGGDFEAAPSSWSLTGGAQQASGSESFAATGSLGTHSLSLPVGASAQTPYTCVNASYPSFRFFARTVTAKSTISVQVVYHTVLGTLALPVGTVTPSGAWQPTAPMLTGAAVLGVLSGGTAQAALRFTETSGSASIDDVFIDPRMR
jgi:hypothetical protein